jgi:hypothetical protein
VGAMRLKMDAGVRQTFQAGRTGLPRDRVGGNGELTGWLRWLNYTWRGLCWYLFEEEV